MLEIVQSVIQAFLMRLTWFANALMHLNCLCFVQFLSRQLDRTEQARIRSFLLQQYASYRLQKKRILAGECADCCCMYVHTYMLASYYVSNPFAKLSLGQILNCLGLLAQYTPLQQLTLLLLPTVVCQYTASLYGYSVYSVYITTVCLIIITA